MNSVRAKMKVMEIKRSAYNPQAAEITLEAVYTGSPEDNTFSEATPSARLVMQVSNPEAVENMPLGQQFYVDFTPVD